MLPIPIPGFTDPVSSWTHLLAAGAAALGAVFLWIRGRGNGGRLFSLMVFSFALIFLFSMSGVFHLLDRGGDARSVLQRLDHAGIWTLIAGTFTPIHWILFRGHWRWTVLLTVWTLAITALVLEVVFFDDFPEVILLSLFLGLGWFGGLTGYAFRKTYGDPSLKLLIAGGVSYSIGAVIDFSKTPDLWPGVIGAHEIFHLFVIGGALCHWLFVFQWAAHPVQNQLLFHVHLYPDDEVWARAVDDHIQIRTRGLEQAKAEIRRRVFEKYHARIQPQVLLRYFRDEWLSVDREK